MKKIITLIAATVMIGCNWGSDEKRTCGTCSCDAGCCDSGVCAAACGCPCEATE